jgi:DNA-binding XRE family transcriptional regulator
MADAAAGRQEGDEDAAGRSLGRDGGATRKRRRWGDAAKRARRLSAANGGRTRRRSLKAIREAEMLTQVELADYCNLSWSTFAWLEKGRRPQPSTARIIAAILKVEVTAIAWGREE